MSHKFLRFDFTPDIKYFAISGSCDSPATGKQNEHWTLYCDADGDGAKDEAEATINIVMNKKCKKIVSGPKSFNCGDGEERYKLPLMNLT